MNHHVVSMLILAAALAACSSKEGDPASSPSEEVVVDCSGLQACCDSMADEARNAECLDVIAAAQGREDGSAFCEEALAARVDSGDCVEQGAGGSGAGGSGEGGSGEGGSGTGGQAGCAGSQSQCAKGCFDLSSDLGNCGSCGLKCPGITRGHATCVGGECGLVCDAPYEMCWSQCLDTRSDVNNCGGCENVCPSKAGYSTVCSNGKCGLQEIPCPAGTGKCDSDYCQDLSDDSANCGACGVSCWVKAEAAGVDSGQCVASQCIGTLATTCDSLQSGCQAESCDTICAKKNMKCDASRVMPSCSSWQAGPCALYENWNGTQSCHIDIDCSKPPSEGEASCPWDVHYFKGFECPCTGLLP